MDINVSTEKLRRFSEYIDNFQKNVLQYCNNLAAVITDVSSRNTDLEDVQEMMNQIKSLISNAAPNLDQLKRKVIDYAELVESIKKKLS